MKEETERDEMYQRELGKELERRNSEKFSSSTEPSPLLPKRSLEPTEPKPSSVIRQRKPLSQDDGFSTSQERDRYMRNKMNDSQKKRNQMSCQFPVTMLLLFFLFLFVLYCAILVHNVFLNANS